MKRTAYVFGVAVLLAAFVSQARGQSIIDTSTASNWYLGIKGGLRFSTVWGPDRPDPSGALVSSVLETILPGAVGGVTLPLWFSEHFVLEPQLLLSTAGLGWTVLDTLNYVDTVRWNVNRRFVYLEVPVLVKLVLLEDTRRFRPVLYAGPQISLCIYGKTSWDVDAGSSYSNRTYSLADSVPLVDIAGVAGLALQIRAGRGYFTIDARGTAGIVNIGNGEEPEAEYPRVLRNLHASGSIGYCFNPKRRKSLW